MKSFNNGLWGNRMEILLGISVISAFILPHTSTLLRLANPILCVLLFLFKKNKALSYFCYVPILAIFISLMLNIGGDAASKSIFAALAIVIYLLFFPFVCGTKIKNIYIYITFGLIFLSQIGYIFQLTPIVTLVDRFYPITWNEKGITHMIETVDISNYTSFRMGGLYRNPNQCAKYVTFLLSVFLINNRHKTFVFQIWFIILCFFSVLLTGSRTGLVVSSALIIIAMYNGKINKWIMGMVIAAFGGIILYGIMNGGGFRGFEVSEGFSNSMGAKFNITMKYIAEEPSVIKLLFGHLDSDLFDSGKSYSLDCEYGYVIYCYGFVGFTAFLLFYIRLFKRLGKGKKMFFLILLWMISSSIFMAYRAAFVFMLLLSTIYGERKTDAESKEIFDNSLQKP